MAEELRVFVRAAGERREIAAFEGARLVEYVCEEGAENALSGAVLLGRVERVLPGMQAAFVRIGQPLNGFLPLREQESFGAGAALRTDASVIVQVKKDPHGDKGAFLSRDVALPGQYLLFMPCNRHIGVSKRVTDEAERAELIALGAALSGGAFGLILRHAALGARRDAIETELSELQARWKEMTQLAEHAKPPATLWREPSVLTALARDCAARYTLRLTCNDAVNRMPAAQAGLHWEQVSDLELDTHLTSLRLKAQLCEALGRRVSLANGGTLVIDEREALTTIDVNTGAYVGAKDDRDVALRQNLAACPEIARQIRLRNLTGILLIDFIDLPDEAQRAQVNEALRAELAKDRVPSVIHGFTSLGLLELTRRRTRESLREALCAPCTRCGGTGWERSQA